MVSRGQQRSFVGFRVLKVSTHSVLEAEMIEQRPDLRIERLLWSDAGPSGVSRDSLGNLKISGTDPFIGSAEYHPASDANLQWSGDLSGVFPGIGAVALTGPGFLAHE
jgi:hypothetical protein